MQSEIFTAPPWEGCLVSHTKDYQKITKVHTYELSITYGCKACFEFFFHPASACFPPAGQRPTDDDATEMDREVDKRITQAQTLRFCKRNVLEVKREVVRCKLCYKTLPSARACEEHISKDHEEDFKKELKMWERFLFTTCKRQPPFGWVCKICQTFFASDGACWRHVGKEVYIKFEERHMGAWHEKEDRWGHAEDEECCGDGINAGGGMSYESVLAFNKAQADEERENERLALKKASQQVQEESSSSDDDEPVGKMQQIEEF